MGIEVVPYRPDWLELFVQVAATLERTLRTIRVDSIEHVGSTSVPGLAAKPILDIDIIVQPDVVPDAVAALQGAGYRHLGDLGLAGREAFAAPDDRPRRSVYVCEAGTLRVRNHFAVRAVLRRSRDLRDRYAAVKLGLAADPAIDIETYTAGKSAILDEILTKAGLSVTERDHLRELNARRTP